MSRNRKSRRPASRGWDNVAGWYAGMVGTEGSDFHRAAAVPALLDLLAPRPGERILDVGCGPGVLAPSVASAGAHLTGVDASRRLVAVAARRHGRAGRFIVGDATALEAVAGVAAASFDAAVYLLSIQDIDPLEATLAGAAWALRPRGRIVIVMTHPCFRVPRQSGWGYDERRALQYRRIDRYLTPLDVPMKSAGAGRGSTWSHHRPLGAYIAALSAAGLVVDQLREMPVPAVRDERLTRPEAAARREIPLFLALRALKL